MADNDPITLDIAVIGGGPAGISACLELAKSERLKIALFESEDELGGMPRSCHLFFGMRDLGRIYTGPGYARRLNDLIRKTDVEIHTMSTVIQITPGETGMPHMIKVASPAGIRDYACRFVVLCTGCYETSREARRIPGSRPSGVYTTGSLQQLVNRRQLKVGKRAVIIGSEHVAFSAVLSLRHAGISIAGIVEQDASPQTYPIVSRTMKKVFRFPIYTRATSIDIAGKRRVEGISFEIGANDKKIDLECDTIICTGKFRPDASLIYKTQIEEDAGSLGPSVDMNYMTHMDRIYAAGNVLRGADMHDICSLEGRYAARSIIRRARNTDRGNARYIALTAERPIRYVVPQRVPAGQDYRRRSSFLRPGFSFQTSRNIGRAQLEAWYKEERIWSKSFGKLIANTRIPLPLEEFDIRRADAGEKIILKLIES